MSDLKRKLNKTVEMSNETALEILTKYKEVLSNAADSLLTVETKYTKDAKKAIRKLTDLNQIYDSTDIIDDVDELQLRLSCAELKIDQLIEIYKSLN